jgi:hypothetical protein
MPDRYVTVHRGGDAIEAEILRDVLLDAGIAARLLGIHREAPLGVTAATHESRVDVPVTDGEEALRIVAETLPALREAAAADAAVDGDEAGTPERPLRALFAAGIVGICPGGGHFYARRPLVGLAILGGELTAVLALGAGGSRTAVASLALCALLVADLLGAQLAVRAWNRGVRASRVRQSLHGLAVLVGASAFAGFVAPVVQRLPARHNPYSPTQEIRRGAEDPRGLPFPLHLDFRR